jgi:HTH-type transcriptional repressor of NAD biosynthesis genes
VIGKFYPLHKGHSHLINFANQRVDQLDVLVCDSPEYSIKATKRATWIKHLHQDVNVRIIKDIGKDDDSPAWAKHTIKFLGYSPDVVFSSEDYGISYARCMNSEHVMVDKERVQIPICATRIREDVLKEWDYLDPIVRSNFTIRTCVLGAESTGTTTLSKALAKHYKTAWVPEYGRYYTESLNDPYHIWRSQEFVHIAKIQQTMENQLAGYTNGLLICDTNAFATNIWHERYMGQKSKEVKMVANNDKVDLYILTGDEIPFEQDSIRDGEHIRHDMHKRFEQELKKLDTPYLLVRGDIQSRLIESINEIDKLTRKKVKIC